MVQVIGRTAIAVIGIFLNLSLVYVTFADVHLRGMWTCNALLALKAFCQVKQR
jgi:hypothetical protein